MSELREGSIGRECCFKCAYVIHIGSKSGAELKRDKSGKITDPRLDAATGSLCLHNPDAEGKGLGFAVRVCDLFELDKERYYDLTTAQWEHDFEMSKAVQPVSEEDDDAGSEDCPIMSEPCPGDDPRMDSNKAIAERGNRTMHGMGFKVARDRAVKAVQWFNGGRPATEVCPLTVMRNEDVCDTDCIPVAGAGRTYWSSLELEAHLLGDAWGEAANKMTVWLESTYQCNNGGGGGPIITHVRTVQLDGDVLTVSGYSFGSEAQRSDWREVTVSLEVVEKAEAKVRPAPEWYLDLMDKPVAADEWLGPATTAPTTRQTYRQVTLEDFA